MREYYGAVAAAVQVVLHVVRRNGTRGLAAVGVLEREGELVRVLPAWQDGRWGPGRERLRELLEERGESVAWPGMGMS